MHGTPGWALRMGAGCCHEDARACTAELFPMTSAFSRSPSRPGSPNSQLVVPLAVAPWRGRIGRKSILNEGHEDEPEVMDIEVLSLQPFRKVLMPSELVACSSASSSTRCTSDSRCLSPRTDTPPDCLVSSDVGFEVLLDKGACASSLGVRLDLNDEVRLQVVRIVDGGIVASHNATASQEEQINVGDFITEVNGVSGDAKAMVKRFMDDPFWRILVVPAARSSRTLAERGPLSPTTRAPRWTSRSDHWTASSR
mmetsp:Transcript_63298/g.181580  ORF Transcript_63298/g.181580 Transcript_63298/m.181580 type:complete len:254 (+) Transcript_63298:1-762(+)